MQAPSEGDIGILSQWSPVRTMSEEGRKLDSERQGQFQAKPVLHADYSEGLERARSGPIKNLSDLGGKNASDD